MLGASAWAKREASQAATLQELAEHWQSCASLIFGVHAVLLQVAAIE